MPDSYKSITNKEGAEDIAQDNSRLPTSWNKFYNNVKNSHKFVNEKMFNNGVESLFKDSLKKISVKDEANIYGGNQLVFFAYGLAGVLSGCLGIVAGTLQFAASPLFLNNTGNRAAKAVDTVGDSFKLLIGSAVLAAYAPISLVTTPIRLAYHKFATGDLDRVGVDKCRCDDQVAVEKKSTTNIPEIGKENKATAKPETTAPNSKIVAPSAPPAPIPLSPKIEKGAISPAKIKETQEAKNVAGIAA